MVNIQLTTSHVVARYYSSILFGYFKRFQQQAIQRSNTSCTWNFFAQRSSFQQELPQQQQLHLSSLPGKLVKVKPVVINRVAGTKNSSNVDRRTTGKSQLKKISKRKFSISWVFEPSSNFEPKRKSVERPTRAKNGRRWDVGNGRNFCSKRSKKYATVIQL